MALGTSMPDLFASQVAAQEDPTADASIVNVTGSNSVNVFLGLGLPWTIATIYWEFCAGTRTKSWADKYERVAERIDGDGMAFVVPSALLGCSIIVFCVTCVASVSLLVFRRRCMGIELGGPRREKFVIAGVFVAYWIGYIIVVPTKQALQTSGRPACHFRSTLMRPFLQFPIDSCT